MNKRIFLTMVLLGGLIMIVLAGLGPRILRAETAPLYALSAISVLVELE